MTNHPDSSDNQIVTVFDVSHSFEELAILKEQVSDLLTKCQALAESILNKDQEISHLKALLSSTVPLLLQVKDESPKIKQMTSEEIICRTQIELLLSESSIRSLTLEEVKKLDLLNKNLILITEPRKTDKVKDVTPNSPKKLQDKHYFNALLEVAGKAIGDADGSDPSSPG